MRGAEGDDGGDEGHGWHPDRDGGAQVADVLLAQGGKSARDVRESDGDAVVAPDRHVGLTDRHAERLIDRMT